MGFAACKHWLMEQLYLLRAIFHGMAFQGTSLSFFEELYT